MREIQTLEGLEEPTVSMAWSLYGDTILQASKNGVIRLFDPRAQAAPIYTGATDFVAAKGVNVTFINDSRDYFTTGFSKSVHRCRMICRGIGWHGAGDPHHVGSLAVLGGHRSGDRQICRWDPRRPGTPVHTTVAGNSPGGLTPYMDVSLGILYVACKVAAQTHARRTKAASKAGIAHVGGCLAVASRRPMQGEGLRMYEVSAQDGHLDFMTEIRTDRPQVGSGHGDGDGPTCAVASPTHSTNLTKLNRSHPNPGSYHGPRAGHRRRWGSCPSWSATSTSARLRAFSSSGARQWPCARRVAPGRGADFSPPRVLTFSLTRILNLEPSPSPCSNDSAIQTVSVRVPRKLADGAFPDDLYPPTFADAPALTIDRWLKGQTVPPLLHSMRPEDGLSCKPGLGLQGAHTKGADHTCG